MANNKKRKRKRPVGNPNQLSSWFLNLKDILNKLSETVENSSRKLLVFKKIAFHPIAYIFFLVLSLILNVIAAMHIFEFNNYAIDLEIKRTGYGLTAGLFMVLLIPGMLIVYPIILLIHIGLSLYYFNDPKGRMAILLPWMFMLVMYAPALLVWCEHS